MKRTLWTRILVPVLLVLLALPAFALAEETPPAEIQTPLEALDITVRDSAGQPADGTLPAGDLLATVRIRNNDSAGEAMIVLASYRESGQFSGLYYVSVSDFPVGGVFSVTFPVDNTDGELARLKAFTIGSFLDFTPQSDVVSYPAEPEPEPQPEPEPEPEPVDPADTLTIGEDSYTLGMSLQALTDLAGQPDEILASTAGHSWYVFGTEDYTDFFAAGVTDETVVRLVSAGKSFSCMEHKAGDTDLSDVPKTNGVTLYTDRNDNSILHAVMLTASAAPSRPIVSDEALRGESVMSFHLTNAFRVYHGLTPYIWSEPAAEAARLHSQDMADLDYFHHYSLDGRSPADRLAAQGLSFITVGENIVAGLSLSMDAYDGWVNSSGHRDNLLDDFQQLGVGAGYSGSSRSGWYMTQDFLTPDQPSPTPEPEPLVPADTLIIGEDSYTLGMSLQALTDLAGQPDEILASTAGHSWYVFGTEDYTDFFAAGVTDETVVRLVSAGKSFSCMEHKAGDTDLSDVPKTNGVTLYTDRNDNSILHAVMLTASAAPSRPIVSDEALRGESVMSFHLTNAFRVYHGLTPYIWSEPAAEAARLHSQDMADLDYFHHYSLDGRSPADRLAAQGLSFITVGENIVAGPSLGVDTYNGWVNSEGHRSNLLGNFRQLGVGAGYNGSSRSGWYMTQDFFTER